MRIVLASIPVILGKTESKHPLLKAKIVEAVKLEDDELKEAIRKMFKSKDVKNLVNMNKIDLEKSIAVKHILEVDGVRNTLLALGAPLINVEKKSEIVYYTLENPIEWLKTEAWLIIHESKGISVVRSINSGKVMKPSNNEFDYSECSCIEQCQNDWDCGGPPKYMCSRMLSRG